jgi:hypothetical protein
LGVRAENRRNNPIDYGPTLVVNLVAMAVVLRSSLAIGFASEHPKIPEVELLQHFSNDPVIVAMICRVQMSVA